MTYLRRKIVFAITVVFSMNAGLSVFVDRAIDTLAVKSTAGGTFVVSELSANILGIALPILLSLIAAMVCYQVLNRTVLASLDSYREHEKTLSRQAEMSDIATSVMHNIGNVMTNISVLTSSMSSQLQSSKVQALTKSTDLIDENRDHLSDFLNNDDRGKRLPEFICRVSRRLGQEHAELREMVGSLSMGLEHVNQILETQQRVQRNEAAMQQIDVRSLVDDAVGILRASLDNTGVQVSIKCIDLPIVTLDHAKALQLIVNLLANARDAVKDLEADRRHIEIHVSSPIESHFSIQVIDQGSGITQENLRKIFSSGFTTKATGNGQGLHFCAIAAKEMQGSLQATSDGLDKGATFALTLPFVRASELVY